MNINLDMALKTQLVLCVPVIQKSKVTNISSYVAIFFLLKDQNSSIVLIKITLLFSS